MPRSMVLILPQRLAETSAAGAGRLVVGVDDAGRGAIAGPIFAAGVHLPPSWAQPEDPAARVRDAKLLRPPERRAALDALERAGAVWAVGEVSAEEVDALGHMEATASAMRLAVERLVALLARSGHKGVDTIAAVHSLVDGDAVPRGLSGAAIVRGDATEACIAAASVAARVCRDAAMLELRAEHPEFEFDVNGGHASAEHVRALARWGPCNAHRASCFPLAARAGRRYAYHPLRREYKAVRRHVDDARRGGEEEVTGRGADDAARVRERSARYRALLARAPDGAGASRQTRRQRNDARRRARI